MAGLDFPLSTLHPSPREDRRMTRGQTGSLFLGLCGSFIRNSHPAFTGAFPDPFLLSFCFCAFVCAFVIRLGKIQIVGVLRRFKIAIMTVVW